MELDQQIQEGNTDQKLPYHTHNGVDSPILTVSESSLNLSDVTTGDATTARHGLLPKLSGTATEFLDGTGDYDTVKDSDLSTSDITTNNASTSKHGFLKKLDNSTSNFMRGDGEWAPPSNIGGTFTAGEAITSGNAVIVGDGTTYNHITQGTTDGTRTINISSNTMCGQTFATGSTAMTLGSVRLYSISRSGGGTMDVRVDIYATSGGLPTGAAIGSSDTQNSWGGGDLTLTFSNPVNLSASTTYAFVIVSPQNYVVAEKSGDPYTSGTEVTSGDSGASWGTESADLEFDVNAAYWGGYVYQASAASNNPRANNFFGFATATISAFSTGQIITAGVVTGLSGLTIGRSFLSDTLGAVSTSAGTQSRKIGIATSATTFFIKHDNP